MSNTDFKKTLRKMDYMQCSKDVLYRVGQWLKFIITLI